MQDRKRTDKKVECLRGEKKRFGTKQLVLNKLVGFLVF